MGRIRGDRMNVLEQVETAFLNWLKRRETDRLLHKYGGVQTCPWCRQIAQSKDGWSFEPDYRPESSYQGAADILTCGVCGGTSLWMFEVGMVYRGPLDAP